MKDYSNFDASDRNVYNAYCAMRGVQRVVVEGERKNIVVLREGKAPTMQDFLTASRPYVSEVGWSQFENTIRKLYKP